MDAGGENAHVGKETPFKIEKMLFLPMYREACLCLSNVIKRIIDTHTSLTYTSPLEARVMLYTEYVIQNISCQ